MPPYPGYGYDDDPTQVQGVQGEDKDESPLKKLFNAVKAAVIFQRRDLTKYTQRRENSQAAQEWRREAEILNKALDEYQHGVQPSLPPVGDECAPDSLRRSRTLLGSIRRKKRSDQDSNVVVVRSSEAYNRLEFVPTVAEEEVRKRAERADRRSRRA